MSGSSREPTTASSGHDSSLLVRRFKLGSECVITIRPTYFYWITTLHMLVNAELLMGTPAFLVTLTMFATQRW